MVIRLLRMPPPKPHDLNHPFCAPCCAMFHPCRCHHHPISIGAIRVAVCLILCHLSLIHQHVKNIFNVPVNHERFEKFTHNDIAIARSKATWQSYYLSMTYKNSLFGRNDKGEIFKGLDYRRRFQSPLILTITGLPRSSARGTTCNPLFFKPDRIKSISCRKPSVSIDPFGRTS